MELLLQNLDLTIEGILMILGGGSVLLIALAEITGIKVLRKIGDKLKGLAAGIKNLAIKVGIRKEKEVLNKEDK